MITIRLVTFEDLELITNMGRRTFIEAFAHLNNPVHFNAYLNSHHVLEAVEIEFNNPKNQFYIAEVDFKPAGLCKLVLNENEGHPKLQKYTCLELERIYVLKQFQGRGIGNYLFKKAEEIGRDNNFEILWLGVWEKNLKAIEIYKKWGFSVFATHIFDLGGDLQTDLMMKKHLTV
ncbi:MAG: GNAT family N-acetyltransferase [Flavobacterium sp.]|nr:GNAT family N-acetyltransferase [Pedobacter sp.]